MASRRRRRSQQRKLEPEEAELATREEETQPLGELIGLMRHFMEGQQRRDEGFLAELKGLRASMPVPQTAELKPAVHNLAPAEAVSPAEGSSMSLRLDLPTPAPRRARSSPIDPHRMHVSSRDDLYRLEARPYGDPKIPPYVAGEDIESYLLRFERMAKTWGWPQSEWACRLVPLLSGKALEAYTAMDEERAHQYPDLREALLAKFDVSPETYRQQFRASMVPQGENPTETYHRLKGLYRRWIRPEQHTKEQIGEHIILEQLLRVLPADIRTWVKEHEPADGLAASKLALQYINARRGGPAAHPGGPGRQFQAQPRPAGRGNYQPSSNPSSAASQQGTALPPPAGNLSNQDYPVPSADGRLGGEVQPDAEEDAAEVRSRHWAGLGPMVTLPLVRIQGGSSSLHRVLPVRAVVWLGRPGAIGSPAEDVGGAFVCSR
ncbi:uncharacterized protein [Antennarius striatus]|uniref:uncharacterized protein n=1 Tax=Antennarius striatus TaxID=241820 RepID=UPI0035B23426